jgi:hypothetical protein
MGQIVNKSQILVLGMLEKFAASIIVKINKPFTLKLKE